MEKVEIYNPRQGIMYTEDIGNICLAISDKTMGSILSEIIDFSDRDLTNT